MSLEKIAVLVSTGRHPVSGEPRYCRNDGIALTLGRTLAKNVAGRLDVLHAGDAADPALEDYLALGAERIRVIAGTSGMVARLAAQVQSGGVDLVLTGSRSGSGEGSGLLPYLLAETLGCPVMVDALEVHAVPGGVEVLQFLPKGRRRRVRMALPAVIAVHPLASVALRYAHANRVAGVIERLPMAAAAPEAAVWNVEPARRPVKLQAREQKAGHARMLSSIGGQSKGGAVVIDGNHVEKAQVVLAYLREHRLIDF